MSFSEFAIFDHHYGVRRRQYAGIRGALSLRGVVGAVCDYCRHGNDYRALMDMPDYLLEDIGLDRADVTAAKRRHAFWPARD
ncbi:MAG: DUF1127 domain-containing protein [Kiloniellaceae bacterium]